MQADKIDPTERAARIARHASSLEAAHADASTQTLANALATGKTQNCFAPIVARNLAVHASAADSYKRHGGDPTLPDLGDTAAAIHYEVTETIRAQGPLRTFLATVKDVFTGNLRGLFPGKTLPERVREQRSRDVATAQAEIDASKRLHERRTRELASR